MYLSEAATYNVKAKNCLVHAPLESLQTDHQPQALQSEASMTAFLRSLGTLAYGLPIFACGPWKRVREALTGHFFQW